MSGGLYAFVAITAWLCFCGLFYLASIALRSIIQNKRERPDLTGNRVPDGDQFPVTLFHTAINRTEAPRDHA